MCACSNLTFCSTLLVLSGSCFLTCVCFLLTQVSGGDSVQSNPRPQGFPVLRRAHLQGHVLPHPPPRPSVHLAVQHARWEQLAVGRGRLGDQPLRPNAPHVHVLPGLGCLQLHLQGDADGQRSDGESQHAEHRLGLGPWRLSAKSLGLSGRLHVWFIRSESRSEENASNNLMQGGNIQPLNAKWLERNLVMLWT